MVLLVCESTDTSSGKCVTLSFSANRTQPPPVARSESEVDFGLLETPFPLPPSPNWTRPLHKVQLPSCAVIDTMETH